MRKIAFPSNEKNIKKIMLYESSDGTYVFIYDTMYDTGSLFDSWYENVSDAEQACEEDFDIRKDDWILISDPQIFCQHDVIRPTRVKDSKFEFDKSQPLAGMTVNERLFVTGLLEEFERAKKRDKKKAKKILEALQIDNESIEKILWKGNLPIATLFYRGANAAPLLRL